jgi:hypothetical protein
MWCRLDWSQETLLGMSGDMSCNQTRAVPKWLSWSNMLAVCRRACAGKRTRQSVARFLLQQEDELVRLQAELLEARWKPSVPPRWSAASRGEAGTARRARNRPRVPSIPRNLACPPSDDPYAMIDNVPAQTTVEDI